MCPKTPSFILWDMSLIYDVKMKCKILQFPFDRLVLAYSEDEKNNAFQSLHSLYSKS